MRTGASPGPWATREKMFACVTCARCGVVFTDPSQHVMCQQQLLAVGDLDTHTCGDPYRAGTRNG